MHIFIWFIVNPDVPVPYCGGPAEPAPLRNSVEPFTKTRCFYLSLLNLLENPQHVLCSRGPDPVPHSFHPSCPVMLPNATTHRRQSFLATVYTGFYQVCRWGIKENKRMNWENILGSPIIEALSFTESSRFFNTVPFRKRTSIYFHYFNTTIIAYLP